MHAEDGWATASPGEVVLTPGVIHVWLARLDGSEAAGGPSSPGAWGEGLLSPEERERAGGMASVRLRRRFVQAHAALRVVLAGYLRVDPAAVVIETEPNGKPRLPDPSPLRFNLSHSGDVALIACAADHDVGVDVQRIDRRRDVDALADVFTPEERAELMALPPAARHDALFRAWAKKEACLKAVGAGLRVSTRAFTVGTGFDAVPRAVTGLAVEDGPLRVYSLSVGGDHAAAVAAAGEWGVRALRLARASAE